MCFHMYLAEFVHITPLSLSLLIPKLMVSADKTYLTFNMNDILTNADIYNLSSLD